MGVGNDVLDEAVKCFARLKSTLMRMPEIVMDGGTLGIRLMDAIMGCDLLIVVDAVLAAGGTLAVWRARLRLKYGFRDSMHQTDLVDTLICDCRAQAGCGRDRHGPADTTRWNRAD